MKKLYLTTIAFILLLSSFSLTAGDGKDSLKKDIDPYPSFKGFVTNKFWDNWEISLGFGTGFSVYSSNNQGAWGDRFGINGEFSVAKWLHPVVGVRAGLQGGNFNTVRGDEKIKWPFLYGHVDAMLNMSNWIGGYKEEYSSPVWDCMQATSPMNPELRPGHPVPLPISHSQQV